MHKLIYLEKVKFIWHKIVKQSMETEKTNATVKRKQSASDIKSV